MFGSYQTVKAETVKKTLDSMDWISDDDKSMLKSYAFATDLGYTPDTSFNSVLRAEMWIEGKRSLWFDGKFRCQDMSELGLYHRDLDNDIAALCKDASLRARVHNCFHGYVMPKSIPSNLCIDENVSYELAKLVLNHGKRQSETDCHGNNNMTFDIVVPRDKFQNSLRIKLSYQYSDNISLVVSQAPYMSIEIYSEKNAGPTITYHVLDNKIRDVVVNSGLEGDTKFTLKSGKIPRKILYTSLDKVHLNLACNIIREVCKQKEEAKQKKKTVRKK